MHVLIFVAFLVLARAHRDAVRDGLLASARSRCSPRPRDPFWVEHPTLLDVYDGYLLVKDVVALWRAAGRACTSATCARR